MRHVYDIATGLVYMVTTTFVALLSNREEMQSLRTIKLQSHVRTMQLSCIYCKAELSI